MLHLAKKVARRSSFKYQVGAVISKNGRVLSIGHNYIGYCKILPNRPYPESVHAEQSAIAKMLGKRRISQLENASIFVSRASRLGFPRLARPCGVCLALIKNVGIRHITYTTNTGVEHERV